MKTVTILAMICAFSIYAQETTKKINEKRNPDGTLRWRIETTSRDKTPIFRIHQTFTTGLTNTTRSYMVGGEMVMMEVDENGDGLFETMIVYRPSKSDLEVFDRSHDGAITPVSARTLAAYKKQHAAITGFWDHAFDKNMDGDKFVNEVQATQRKIRDSEKEKKERRTLRHWEFFIE